MEKKICIVPCSGMGKVLGSIAREIGFIVTEDLRINKTHLICIPSLSAGEKEYANMIKNNPSIVIDGCFDKCATKIIESNGGEIKASFFLPRSIKKYGIKPKNREDIGIEGKELANHVAQDIVKEVDRLVDENSYD